MNRHLTLALATLFISATATGETTDGNDIKERTKSKLVSRLYQATYGYSEKCSKATLDAAKEFENELSRFESQNSNLMNLVTQSPYYKPAQLRFSKYSKIDPTKDTPESIAKECQFLTSLMREMNDTAKGKEVVREYEAALSK